ncbi:MAG: hypothetical protein ACO1RT_16155 [Planctomycetaceae bacterium]
MITNIPNWQSLAPAEIAAYCAAHHESARPMDVQLLRNWLADNRIAWFGISGGWKGPLVDLVSAPIPGELVAGIERLLSHLASPGSLQADSHLPAYGPLLAGIVTALGLSDELIASLYALGGGRKYPIIDEPTAEALQVSAMTLATAQATARSQLIQQAAMRSALRHAMSDAEAMLEDPASLPTVDAFNASMQATITANWPEV